MQKMPPHATLAQASARSEESDVCFRFASVVVHAAACLAAHDSRRCIHRLDIIDTADFCEHAIIHPLSSSLKGSSQHLNGT